MPKSTKELQRINGIGEILATRLLEAGIDSFAAITKAGESGLKLIKGITTGNVKSILDQAAKLSNEKGGSKEELVAAVRTKCLALRNSIQSIAETAKARLLESLKKKNAEKLTISFVRFIDTLDKVEEIAHKRIKRAHKALTKAEKRICNLSDAGQKDLRNGLNRARRSLRRALNSSN